MLFSLFHNFGLKLTLRYVFTQVCEREVKYNGIKLVDETELLFFVNIQLLIIFNVFNIAPCDVSYVFLWFLS